MAAIPDVRRKPARPPPPRNLPGQYQFCQPGSGSLSSVQWSPEKKVSEGFPGKLAPSSSSTTTVSPAPSPTSLRRGTAPVVLGLMPPARPSPVPLPRQRRYRSDAGLSGTASVPVAKPRQQQLPQQQHHSPVPKTRVATSASPSVPPRPQQVLSKTTPATPPCPAPRPRTGTFGSTRSPQPVARRANNDFSLSTPGALTASLPGTETLVQNGGHLPAPSETAAPARARSMPRLVSPVQLKRRQPPSRPPVGPRLPQSSSATQRPAEETPQHFLITSPKPAKPSSKPTAEFNTLPKPSRTRPPVEQRISPGSSASPRPSAKDQPPPPAFFNTLPKLSRTEPHLVSPPHQERARPASDCVVVEDDFVEDDFVEDNVYDSINDALSVESAEDSHAAPLYAVPDEERMYAGLIAATKDQGDTNYVALARIPADQQQLLETEEGCDDDDEEAGGLYTIPGSNPLYMSINPATKQVDLPYQQPNLIANPASH